MKYIFHNNALQTRVGRASSRRQLRVYGCCAVHISQGTTGLTLGSVALSDWMLLNAAFISGSTTLLVPALVLAFAEPDVALIATAVALAITCGALRQGLGSSLSPIESILH